VVDSAALGFPLAAFVAVRQAPGYHWEQLERAFEALPAVEACHSVTGDDSYLLQVRVPDPRALEDLLRAINAVDGIASTRTILTLGTRFERLRIA
jgi:Lrp/AsnC family leucine-responsive transcriptional regulator